MRVHQGREKQGGSIVNKRVEWELNPMQRVKVEQLALNMYSSSIDWMTIESSSVLSLRLSSAVHTCLSLFVKGMPPIF